MYNLEKLHSDYIKAKAEYAQGVIDLQQKSKEVSGLKRDITEIKSRSREIQRDLDNTRKGVGIPVNGPS